MADPRPTAEHMRRFWDARAREDAMYFVDNTGGYGQMDPDRFFAEGEKHLDALLGQTQTPVGPDDTIVDVGCGLGRLTRVLAGRAAHVHAGQHAPPGRLKVLLGRAPKGQRDPAWRGSAVDLERLAGAAADGGLVVERTVGAGTQFCFVALRRERG